VKRILYFHHGGGIGGAPLSLLYLLQRLDRSRYEPVVVTLKPGPVVDLFRSAGIETHIEPGISDFSHTTLEWYGGREWWRLPGKLLRIMPSIHRARELVRSFSPALVHLNSSTLAPCAVACARERIPVVWHIREPLAQGVFGLRRALLRYVIDRYADRVIAISQYDAEQLIPSKRIHVIYNFVDFALFDRSLSGERVRTELGIPPDAPVVVMLGGAAEPKGALILVQAFPALRAAVPGVQAIIAGPPPCRAPEPGIKGIAKRLLGAYAYDEALLSALRQCDRSAQAALHFIGIRQDIPPILAAADCLAFPSVVPHFARPIIEAAAMGVPAVASDLGGPRELVLHGETGLLVPPNDPSALASALASILNDPVWGKAMGEMAYQRARSLFDAAANAAATVAMYGDVLGI